MAAMRIQIAVGADAITAVLPDRDLTIPLAGRLRPGKEDPGPALMQGMDRLEAALRDRYGDARMGSGAQLLVALMPSVSETRLIDLPPLGQAEIEAVLRRTASRHFLRGASDLVLGGVRPGRDGTQSSAPVLASAASRQLVESLHGAAAARGWHIERVVTAQAAWLKALQDQAPRRTRAGSGPGSEEIRLVIAKEGEVVHLARMKGERPDRLRRISGADAAEALKEAGGIAGRALVLAEAEVRNPLLRSLAGSGWEVVGSNETLGPSLVAARFAGRALPELISPRMALKRHRRERRITRATWGGAFLMLMAAAAVHLWGLDRTLSKVQQDRAALRQSFAPALAERDSLDRMMERIGTLQGLEQGSTSWVAFLVELSDLLPAGTHLVSLRGDGGRVVVEAVGDRAGEALSALRHGSTFRDARIDGLIRRDLEGGETSRERFTLSMSLVVGGDR